MTESPKKIIVIVGPTGTGKSNLALDLLNNISGEIISADSRQVYRTLEYATNKISVSENLGASNIMRQNGFWLIGNKRINLYDVVAVDEVYGVDRFVVEAARGVERIHQVNQTPIVVGGTGYYIDALLGISPVSIVKPNISLRNQLAELSATALAAKLKEIDREADEVVSGSDWKNRRRLIRYIEIAQEVGSIRQGRCWSLLRAPIENLEIQVKYIGLSSSRGALYEHADRWVEGLFRSDVFFSEMSTLNKLPFIVPSILEGLVIKQGYAWVRGDLSREEAVQLAKFSLHRYIRRQLVWFRQNPAIKWFDVNAVNWSDFVYEELRQW